MPDKTPNQVTTPSPSPLATTHRVPTQQRYLVQESPWRDYFVLKFPCAMYLTNPNALCQPELRDVVHRACWLIQDDMLSMAAGSHRRLLPHAPGYTRPPQTTAGTNETPQRVSKIGLLSHIRPEATRIPQRRIEHALRSLRRNTHPCDPRSRYHPPGSEPCRTSPHF